MKLLLILTLLLFSACTKMNYGAPGQCYNIPAILVWMFKGCTLHESELRKIATGKRVFDGDPEPKYPDDPDDTLQGVDADNDGVRDDVEIYINERFKTYNERMAWKDWSKKAMDFMFEGGIDRHDAREQSFFCIRLIHGFEVREENWHELSEVEKLVFSTGGRYSRYNKQIGKVLAEENKRMMTDGNYKTFGNTEELRLRDRFKNCAFEVQNQEELTIRINNTEWIKEINKFEKFVF